MADAAGLGGSEGRITFRAWYPLDGPSLGCCRGIAGAVKRALSSPFHPLCMGTT